MDCFHGNLFLNGPVNHVVDGLNATHGFVILGIFIKLRDGGREGGREGER